MSKLIAVFSVSLLCLSLPGLAHADVRHPHPTFNKFDTLEDCAVAYMTMEWKEGIWRGNLELFNLNEQRWRSLEEEGLLGEPELRFSRQREVVRERIDIYNQTAQVYLQKCLDTLPDVRDRKVLRDLYSQFNSAKNRAQELNPFLATTTNLTLSPEGPASPLADSLNLYLLMLWNDGIFRGQLELLNLREEAYRVLEADRPHEQVRIDPMSFDNQRARLVRRIESFESIMGTLDGIAKATIARPADLQTFRAIVEMFGTVKRKAIAFNPNIGADTN